MISLATHDTSLVPEKYNKFNCGFVLKAATQIKIPPDKICNVPTGVWLTTTPPDIIYHAVIYGLSKNVITLSTVIDPDYEGEIKVPMVALDEPYYFCKGERVARLVFYKTVDVGNLDVRMLPAS